MRTSRIYLDAPLTTGQSVTLPVDRAHYVKNVLRLGDHQQIILFNGVEPVDHVARISIEGKTVSAQLQSAIHKHNDPSIDIRLIQALGHSEHNDFIVQKATELGISQIVFFNAERTQFPIKPARLDKKISHWRSISISACEQCNRNLVPKIGFSRELGECLSSIHSGNGILLDFNGEKFSSLAQRLSTITPIYIAIGPEGGFNDTEINQLQNCELIACNIGPRVLRMESAAISAVTLVQHYLGDM